MNSSTFKEVVESWWGANSPEIIWNEKEKKNKTGSMLKIYYKIILQKVGTTWPQLIFSHLKSLIASAITIFMSFAVHLWENLTWMSLEWRILETTIDIYIYIYIYSELSICCFSNQIEKLEWFHTKCNNNITTWSHGVNLSKPDRHTTSLTSIFQEEMR
jgi:hypothetical protein